ncbi:MAG: hypothetical protein HZB76_02570 [Chlamydiae bacterium]|nr:hypothetical protein [Chlamydiota bacterium]
MNSKNYVKYVWIRAEGGPNRSVIYYDKDGNKMVRYLDSAAKNPPKGSKSWRHQNPGNVIHGSFAKSHGAIGFAGYPGSGNSSKMAYFAIFPDYDIGRKSFSILLKTEKYFDLTLNEFPRRYTGVSADKPDTEEVKVYRNNLRKISGFEMNRTIRTFEGQEYEKLLDTIQRCEGWYPGDEEIIEMIKIVGVKFLKGKVLDFFVQVPNGVREWISKEKAIRLAEEKLLLAVVVHSQYGTYLRPYPHQQKFRDMMIS